MPDVFSVSNTSKYDIPPHTFLYLSSCISVTFHISLLLFVCVWKRERERRRKRSRRRKGGREHTSQCWNVCTCLRRFLSGRERVREAFQRREVWDGSAESFGSGESFCGVRQQRNNTAVSCSLRPQPGDAEEPLVVLKQKRRTNLDFQRAQQKQHKNKECRPIWKGLEAGIH